MGIENRESDSGKGYDKEAEIVSGIFVALTTWRKT